jgi:ankyrin repeat protein
MVYKSTIQSIYSGSLPVVQLLYRKGGLPINQQSVDGNSALFFACLWGQYEIVNYLLDLGADFTVANSRGETPLSIARKKGYSDIVLLLQQFGATQ